jgi:hypothetical protein
MTDRAIILVRALLTFVLAFMVAPMVPAQTPRAWNETDLDWTFATTCTDGSAAAQNCPATGVRVERATSATGPWSTVVTTTSASVTSHRATGLPAGTNFFRFITLAASGASAPSNVVQSTNTPPLPSPGTLRVTQATAWEVRPNSTGTMVATRIGVVPLTSVCGNEQRTAGTETYTRIDPKLVDLVNWPNVLPPVDVFARCG